MANTMQRAQGATPRSPGEATSTVVEKAGEVGSAISGEARNVAQDAKHHARQVAHESRESLRSEASNQATRVASTLRELGGQLHSMAQSQTGGGVAVDMSQQLTTPRLASPTSWRTAASTRRSPTSRALRAVDRDCSWPAQSQRVSRPDGC